MTINDEVVFSGHGLPMRVPVRLIPGTRHRIEWEVVDELGEGVDQSDTVWTVTMHDALTGELIFTYTDGTVDDTNELAWEATDEQTALLDYLAAYEVRWVRDMPGPDMLAAGPVIFTAHTVPVSEAAA